MPMINEAFFALMEGVATAEDIDVGIRLGTNQVIGSALILTMTRSCISISVYFY